jgi:DNA-binding beta-propeller fold protein YncE
MFTDIVGSTDLASRLGDAGWRRLLSHHHSVVRKQLKRFGGREVDTAGDGFFATFDQPAHAIACARELVDGLEAIGIQIRVGIHMGEVEVTGPKVTGVAVHIGSRVMSTAGPKEIVVSGTVRDLVAGSELAFEDKGIHELKGVPAEWHLYAITPLAREAESAPSPLTKEREEDRRILTPARLIVGAAALLLATVTAFLFFQGGGGLPPVAVNTVAKLDPADGRLLGGIAVGTTPSDVAPDQNGLWVSNFDDQTLQLIDLSSAKVGPARALSGAPTSMTTGGGYVWVVSSFAGVLYRFDPQQAHALETVKIGGGAGGVAFGADSVWVTDSHRDTVLRIDPQTNAVEKRIQLARGSAPQGVAFGDGAVWVAESLTGKIARIDPGSNTVKEEIPLLNARPNTIAFGDGYLWVAATGDDVVIRIDPSSNGTTSVGDVGDGPTGLAVGEGAVWVTDPNDSSIYRIDPVNARVTARSQLPAGMSPAGVAVADGNVWVAVDAP